MSGRRRPLEHWRRLAGRAVGWLTGSPGRTDEPHAEPPPEPLDPPPPPQPLGKDWHRISVIVGSLALVVAVIGVAVTFLTVPGVLGSDDDEEAPPKALLTLDQTIIHNGPNDTQHIAGREVVTEESMPKIDLTFTNRGDAPALIEEARARIVDSAELNICYAQGGGGDVAVTGRYELQLPFKPRPAERVATARFAFAVDPGGYARLHLDVAGSHGAIPELHLLEVSLATREGDLIDVGRVLIGTPQPVPRSGGFLPEEANYFDDRSAATGPDLASLWCYAHNLAAVRRLLKDKASRSDEVEALREVQPAPSFRRRLAETAPADAARRLVRSDTEEDMA
ncbi:MAG: hypothetical protein M3389_03080, partial [Actinomycetota bacterium]|nr:hypothetical protein [Actinomycetota bacterium]